MDAAVALPDLQLVQRPGIIDFGWGHPAPALLPVADLGRAASAALQRDGELALSYGAAQGPGRLIAPLCEHLGRMDGCQLAPEQLLITGGVSQALDLFCTVCTQPGDSVLVESPVYHLALRILRDHGLHLWPVATDGQGLRLDALEQTLAQVRRQGPPARFLYTLPTFSNPTGVSLSAERREALLRCAAQHEFLILEDDVYRELWYEAPPLPPLSSYAGPATVVRFGSFAKVLAPGLRLGWMLGDAGLVQRFVASGLLDSGGGVNHFTAHVVAEYLRDGALERHVAGLRTAYRARRDLLVAALQAHLPVGCQVAVPGGGWFLWVQAPPLVDTTALLPQAEAAGVSYLPGTVFCSDGGGRQHLRLAYSLLSEEELEEGARRLGGALRRVA